MTKTAFLAALERQLRQRAYPWLDMPSPDPAYATRLERFMAEVRTTMDTTQNMMTVTIDTDSFREAWQEIGGKGKPTYKALRALED